MSENGFEQVDQALRERGPKASLDLLAENFRSEKRYAQLFEARLMKKRLELGLPLIQMGSLDDIPEPLRPAYEAEFVAAAREVGRLHLADGDIPRAWSYLRAIGDIQPVAEAIEQAPAGDGIEDIISVAYQEQVHPEKGFQLILEKYGVCRAISAYENYPGRKGREASLRRLVRTLHKDLLDSIKWAIRHHEGVELEAETVRDLIAGREWLFGKYNYYVDPSHVNSVLRFAVESEDPEVLRLALEMAEHGQHLDEQFQGGGVAPFDNTYFDYAIYLRALLGEDQDAAVAHFREKMEKADPEQEGTRPAEVLVNLLVRLERYPEAIRISRERLGHVSASYLCCPTTRQLCQLGGDYEGLMELAREQDDLLSYTAGLLQRKAGAAEPEAARRKA